LAEPDSVELCLSPDVGICRNGGLLPFFCTSTLLWMLETSLWSTKQVNLV
jgi:hypothetical protein